MHAVSGHCAFISKHREENVEGWLPTQLSNFAQHLMVEAGLESVAEQQKHSAAQQQTQLRSKL